MKIVLDAVVFVRGFISPDGPAAHLLDRGREYQIVTSPDLLAELLDVVQRPVVQRKLAPSHRPPVEAVLLRLADAEVIEPAAIERVCRDPNDDKLFACAVAADADYIVSDDKDVLAVGEYGGVRAVTTFEFVQLLDEAARP